MADVVLRCEGLRKTYGAVTAVDDVGFEIAEGEIYGLLGPNGAGKTTTISMVVGILARDSGSVTIDGQPHDVHRTVVKRLIGYVSQHLALYTDLSATENLHFFGRLYGLSGRELRQRAAEVLEVVNLADRAKHKVRTFSGGMSRRLHIAVGLLNRPRLLVLDEPTAGVDPHSRRAILEKVRQLADSGTAVLYTTNYMEEAEQLCDRVGIIDNGQVRAEGTRSELIKLVDRDDEIHIVADGDVTAAAKALDQVPGVMTVGNVDSGVQLLTMGAARLLPEILRTASEAGLEVRSVEVRQPNLEAVFLHLTGKALRD
jgi:ABC-2 type transport system ATP-binding protein